MSNLSVRRTARAPKAVILHGTPITPAALLPQLAGESFCVSFAEPRQLEEVLELQDPRGMLMLDNGAFTYWRQGKGAINRAEFFAWANDIQARCDVAVAVIPDIIGGNEEANWMEAAYAVRNYSEFTERLMFVWHMNDSLDQLKRASMLFNFVAIGSCAEYDVQTNRKAYLDRLTEASAVIDNVERVEGRRPWVHLMRGVGIYAKAIRFESADSSNVARNHCRTKGTPNHVRAMADRIAAPIQETSSGAPTGETYATSNFELDEKATLRVRDVEYDISEKPSEQSAPAEFNLQAEIDKFYVECYGYVPARKMKIAA